MPDVFLRLLGGAEVVQDGVRSPWRTTAPHALLAYLALADGWVGRTELAYLFRPDDPDADALAYLRLQLHRAQRLAWVAGLEATPDRVRWTVASDVARFRSAHEDGDSATVVAAYGGPLLRGFALRGRPTFDAWLELERDRLEARYRSALERWGAARARAGGWADATDAAERRLAIDPFDEGALRALLRALEGAGRRADALARYERFAATVVAELGVVPEPETRAIATALAAGPQVAVPPREARGAAPDRSAASAGGATPTDARAAGPGRPLPRPATAFVGRRRELAELAELLADPGCRVLTVVGLGGSGKTRLALEAARARASVHRDGAVFVPGAEVATLGQLLARLAALVAVELDGARDPTEALVTALADREALLVLDNLEHLPDAADWVADLLAGAPGIQVLATSRVPLGLHAEWSFDVSGLQLPEGDRAEGDAVDLFLAAARRAAPRLDLGPAVRPHVARICRRVAGLPLALELAATWVRAMPVAAIAEALGADLKMLATDRRDVPERHRSLAVVLERTWRDLTEAKQAALMRLAPFVAGCTLETAQQVTGVPGTLWLSLLHQSLLERRDGDRFALHPLVAEHAAARLGERPDLEAAARDAHAHHFVAALERAVGTGSADVIALDPDAADIERAWQRLLERGDLATAVRAAPAFFERYDVRGAFHAGVEAGRATLARLADADTGVAAELRAAAGVGVATLAWEAGDYARARAHGEEALALAMGAGADGTAARAQRLLGDVHQSTGDFDAAAIAYERAEAAFAALADERGQANVLNSWASMDAVRERYREAEARFLRCVALFKRLDATKDVAIARTNLGFVSEAQGALDAAARHYEAGLAVFERIGFVRGQAAVQNNLVVLYGKQGRFDEAEAVGRASLAAKEAIGDTLATVITLKNLGDLALRRGDADAALARYRPALRIALDHGAVPRLLQASVGAAEALARCGETATAWRLARAVAAHPSAAASLAGRARELLETTAGSEVGAAEPLVAVAAEVAAG